MANLLEETLNILLKYGKSVDDIDFVNYNHSYNYNDEDENTGCFDWNWFLIYSRSYTDYDNGYGGAEVGDIEIVFKDGSWLERGEYDGSEWWEFKKTPARNSI